MTQMHFPKYIFPSNITNAKSF